MFPPCHNNQLRHCLTANQSVERYFSTGFHYLPMLFFQYSVQIVYKQLHCLSPNLRLLSLYFCLFFFFSWIGGFIYCCSNTKLLTDLRDANYRFCFIRGLNLVVLNGYLDISTTGNFDTYASSAASADLLGALQALPLDSLVVLLAKDEAARATKKEKNNGGATAGKGADQAEQNAQQPLAAATNATSAGHSAALCAQEGRSARVDQ